MARLAPMRPWLLTAAVPLLLLAACNSSSGAASTSPSPSPLAIPSPSPSPEPTPTPSPRPVPSPPSLYVQIVVWDYGDITAQTSAGAVCNARVVLPNGQEAGGLNNPKIADAGGKVVWVYPQATNQSGIGTAIVSCTRNGLSGSTRAYFPVGT